MPDDKIGARSAAPSIVTTRLGPVQVLSEGSGPALLCLHGGMGGWDQGALLARCLALPGRRVLAVSRPGYLGTPLASGATPPAQADLCAALLDALGIETAVIAAVSAGGPAALQFALRHPHRCSAAILVSTCTGVLAPPPEVEKRLPLMKILARLPLLPALMRWNVRRNPDAAARRAIPDADLRARTLRHKEAGALLLALQLSTFDRLAARLPGTLADMATFAALPDYPFEAIQIPVLAVHGTADRIVPFAHAERVARRVPGAELVAVEGGEHVALFTHLDRVRAAVQAFVASCGL